MIITIVGDLHLAKYRDHCMDGDPEFRDKQFLRLADRIIEEAQKRNSKHLFLAGDIIDKPNISSDGTWLLLSQFIDKVSEYFDDIRYILGQHDLSIRNDDTAYADSAINLFDKHEKMIYCDDKSFELGGRTIYMRNWRKGFGEDRVVLPCPKGTDVFIGHITLTSQYQPQDWLHMKEGGEWEVVPAKLSEEDYQLYRKPSTGGVSAQVIAPDSFKLGVFGDIHAPLDWKNVHSTGCPLQKSMNDEPFGTFAFVNLDDLSFERVQVITPTQRFLRIYDDGDPIPDRDDYVVVRERAEKVSSICLSVQGQAEVNVKISEVLSYIEAHLDEQGLGSIHKEISQSVKDRPEPVCLDFSLLELEVRNFRSVEHYKLNFNEMRGITYIHGKNGAGKSSLMTALLVGLLGDRHIKEYRKAGATEKVYIKVSLIYQDLRYDIERTEGGTNFYIEGKQTNGSGKLDTESFIVETLPFIKYINSFFISHNNPFYVRFQNSKLLENMFNLDLLIKYVEQSKKFASELKKEAKEMDSQISQIEGAMATTKIEIDHADEELSKISETYEVDDKVDYKRKVCLSNPKLIESKKATLQSTKAKIETNPYTPCDNVEELKAEVKSLNEKIAEFDQIKTITARIENNKETIKKKSITCEKCGNVIEIGTEALNKEQEELTAKLQSLETSTQGFTKDQCRTRVSEINDKLDSHANYLNFEKSQRTHKENAQILEGEIKTLEDELTAVVGDSTVEAILKYCEEYSAREYQVSVHKKNKARLEQNLSNLTTSLAESTKERGEMETKIGLYEQYQTILDPKSKHSLYNNIIVRISQTLSDEDIQFTADDKGKPRFCLRVGNEWMDYLTCSDGQKVLMDLLLLRRLSKLLGRIGFMGLDEVAANLDTSSYDRFAGIISEYNVNDMFVMMHSDSFGGFAHSIHVKLVDNTSQFTIE